MLLFRLTLLTFCLLTMSTTSIQAAPQTKEEEQAKAKHYENVVKKSIEKSQNPAEKLRYTVSEFIKKLDKEDTAHFMTMYTNYNLIQTVTMVRTDIGNAVKSCGENNPDLKEKMNTRYRGWTNKIDPIIDESQAHFDNMLIAQDYAPKKEANDIFKMLDDTREKAQGQFKKIPVTTKESCEYMLGKMDETQPDLESMLQTSQKLRPNTQKNIKLKGVPAKNKDPKAE